MFRKSRILIGLMGVWSLSLLLFSGYTRAQKMTFSEPETWMGHSGAVTALAFSPDGQAFVSGGADHLITMWDSNQHLDRGVFRGHQGPVWRWPGLRTEKRLYQAVKIRRSEYGRPKIVRKPGDSISRPRCFP